MQVELRAGVAPTQMRFEGSGNSHIATAHIFRSKLPNHPLNGDIDLRPAMQWFRELRELVNYNNSSMNLDDQLNLFNRAGSIGIRKGLATYLSDISLYAFLKEDAAIAYPIYAATLAASSMHDEAKALAREKVSIVLSRLRDNNGPVKSLMLLQV